MTKDASNISTGEDREDPADTAPAPDRKAEQTSQTNAPQPDAAASGATAEPEKTKITGFSVSFDVIIAGDQSKLEIDQVTEAANLAKEFIDELRQRPDVRLVKLGDQKFGTRKVDPQP